MTLRPWDLPINVMHWGRWIGESASMVWLRVSGRPDAEDTCAAERCRANRRQQCGRFDRGRHFSRREQHPRASRAHHRKQCDALFL